jgi:hypothetical protein
MSISGNAKEILTQFTREVWTDGNIEASKDKIPPGHSLSPTNHRRVAPATRCRCAQHKRVRHDQYSLACGERGTKPLPVSPVSISSNLTLGAINRFAGVDFMPEWCYVVSTIEYPSAKSNDFHHGRPRREASRGVAILPRAGSPKHFLDIAPHIIIN